MTPPREWMLAQVGGNLARMASTASRIAPLECSRSASVNGFFAQPCQTGLCVQKGFADDAPHPGWNASVTVHMARGREPVPWAR
jgi:hypothetical protein